MSSRPEDRPRIVGEPATSVRPAFDLEPDAVRVMLTARSVPQLMELLGMDEQDRAELAPLLPVVADDEELLQTVTDMANLLRREAGLGATAAPLGEHTERLNSLQERVKLGQGLLVILAHMVATDVVRTWHQARGLSEQDSWLALSDLGQQMRVHRATFGELGHHTVGWTALNWTGRLFWFGRLQFDVYCDSQQQWQIGTHIPATGPLAPAEVDDSFDRATTFFASRFGDLGAEPEPGAGTSGAGTSGTGTFGSEFVCHSWLVSDELPGIVGEDSNLGAFARRWEIYKTFPAADDAVFFVFNRRPPYEAAELPTNTRLRAAIVERLLDGRGWTGGRGRLTRS